MEFNGTIQSLHRSFAAIIINLARHAAACLDRRHDKFISKINYFLIVILQINFE